MQRHLKIIVLTIIGLTQLVCAAKKDPNILLILADDLGYSALSSHGNDYYETPNIDKLASEGMDFSDSYATCAVCAPSRCSLLSGQYTGRHGVYWVTHYQNKYLKTHENLDKFKLIQPQHTTQLPLDSITIASRLREAGYATAAFGKWHIGGQPKGNVGDHFGFDELVENKGTHFKIKTAPKVKTDRDYLSDCLGDLAIDFMTRMHEEKKPFFLYLADYLVHAPFEVKEAYMDYFTKKKKSKFFKDPIGAGMTKALDDTVGRVVAHLDTLGIADDTIVIFTSDNGGLAYKEDGKRGNNTSNHPFRNGKGTEFEGGTRVPFIVRYPGVVPAGTVNNTPIIGMDVYPTLLAMTPATAAPQQKLDGADISALLTNPKAKLADRTLFWYLPMYTSFNRPSITARNDKWKAIWLYHDERMELFDLSRDPHEDKDLSAAHPEVVEEFRKAMDQYIQDTGADLMTLNPDYKPGK